MSPNGVTSRMSTSSDSPRSICVAVAGAPILMMRHITAGSMRYALSRRCSRDEPVKSAIRFHQTPTICASTFAAAAPATPISGRPNSPSTRNGVMMRCSTLDAIVDFIGVNESPDACSAAPVVWRKLWNADETNWNCR